MKLNSLRYRIAATIFVLEALMMGTVLWQTLSSSLESSKQQFNTSDQVTLNNLSQLGRIALLTEEYNDMQPFLENAITDPHVLQVLLASETNIIYASSEPRDIGQPTAEYYDTEQTYWRNLEISNATGKLGSIWIRFSNHELESALIDTRNLGLGIAISGMIIIAIAGMMIGVLLTRRLDRLSETAAEFSRGHFSVRVDTHGNDEIDALGQTFNEMAEEVSASLHTLTESEERFRKIFKSANDAIFLFDLANNRIIDANPKACKMLEYEYDELLNTPVSTIHPDEMTEMQRFANEVLEHGSAITDKLTCTTKFHRKISASVSASHTVIGDQNLILAQVRNISDRKQIERLRDTQQDLLEIAARHAGSMPEKLDELCHIMEDQIRNCMCSVMILNDDGESLAAVAGPSLPKGYASAIDGLQTGECAGSCGTAAFHKKQVIVSEIMTDPLWVQFQDVAREYGINACWSTPVYSQDNSLLGTFAVSHTSKRSPTSLDLQLINMAADVIGITIERLFAERDIHAAKEHAEVTLNSIGDAVISVNLEGIVVRLNPVAEILTGWSNERSVGQPVNRIFRVIDEVSREEIESPFERAIEGSRVVGLATHTLLVKKDGTEVAIEDSAAPIRDLDGNITGVVMVFHDVTERRMMAEKLSYQASHDSLTDLVNRREFEIRLDTALLDFHETNLRHCLLYLDLDQFKVVNDTCGHVAGDQLLQQISHLLLENVRSGDVLARLGGDEFGILLEGCPLEHAEEISTKILNAVKEFQFGWDDKTFNIGVSIGLVMITEASRNRDEILSAADTACYTAKEKGRNRVHVYEYDDTDLKQRRGEMGWISRINAALNENRFCLYFQPIENLKDHSQLHGELLVRMIDEDGGIIPPGAFIPAAEHYDKMIQIDTWVVNHAISSISCYTGGAGIIQYSINISGQAMGDKNFTDELVALINETSGVTPENLCFEITETSAIKDLKNAQRFITTIRDLGCKFSLDDFGSGLSSFAYLKTLPAYYLKIDGIFVKDIADDPIDYAMVDSINNIGHVMGKQTIAEYVENDAIVEKLKIIGVDYAQGYGIAVPRPWIEFLEASEVEEKKIS